MSFFLALGFEPVKQGLYPLSHTPSPFFVVVLFLRQGLCKSAQAGLDLVILLLPPPE
jgi:hypothetical protein